METPINWTHLSGLIVLATFSFVLTWVPNGSEVSQLQ